MADFIYGYWDSLGAVGGVVAVVENGSLTVDGGGTVDLVIGALSDTADIASYQITDYAAFRAFQGLLETRSTGIALTSAEMYAHVRDVWAYGSKVADTIVLSNEGNAVVHGRGGNDVISTNVAWNGSATAATDDYLNGGAGDDTLDGGAGNDRLLGAAGADTLYGQAGNDRLYGHGGADTLFGGEGNDFLDGGIGADVMAGGDGNDVYVVLDSGDSVSELGGSGLDQVRAALDYTLGDGLENLLLLSGGRDGTGNELGNNIRGNGTGNTLDGKDGDDILWGYAGADTLVGGTGQDALHGGIGRDTLTGGTGPDIFAFGEGETGATLATADVVTDYSVADGDWIRVTGIDADTGLAGHQAFTVIGTDAFSSTAGQLRYDFQNGDCYLQMDTNGDAVSDYMVHLVGVTALDPALFIL